MTGVDLELGNFRQDGELAVTSAGQHVLRVNPQTLKASLADLLTLQDSTCFIPGDPHKLLEVDCGKDTPAFLYVLLRASTMLLMENLAKDLPQAAEPDPRFKGVSFWGSGGGPAVLWDKCDDLYKELASSPFVSLRSCQDGYNDVAELLTFYHLTRKLSLAGIDISTGSIVAETAQRLGAAATIAADGMLYAAFTDGTIRLVKPNPGWFDIAGEFNISLGSGECWAHPSISGGILFIRHGDVLMAYDVRGDAVRR